MNLIETLTNGGKVIELEYPITKKKLIGSEDVEILTIRRPRAGDLRGLDFLDPEKQIDNMAVIVSRLTGITVKEAERIDLYDFTKISEIVTAMIENSRRGK